MRLTLILLAAGTSRRYNKPKLLEKVDKIPIFVHALRAFLHLKELRRIILVTAPQEKNRYHYHLHTYIRKFLADNPASSLGRQAITPTFLTAHTHLKTILSFTSGGATRFTSVKNALSALNKLETDNASLHTSYVLIHDAARPAIHPQDIKHLVKVALAEKNRSLGVIPGKMPNDTIKRVMPRKSGSEPIIENLSRLTLRAISTPQVFPFTPIYKSYMNPHPYPVASKHTSQPFTLPTDDSEVYMNNNYPVEILPLRYPNIKLTYQEDLAVIKQILEPPHTS